MSSKLTTKQQVILAIKKTFFILLIGLKWTLSFAFIGAFLAGGVVVGYVTSLVKDEPIRDKTTMLSMVNDYDLTGFVYFRDGTQVGQLRTDEDRRLAKSITEIPDNLIDALLSVEDDEFREHYGVDVFGTLRAARQKFLNEDQQTGGSTITQQLARRVFLSLEQTDSRKFKEIFLALRLERMMTKDDILLAYLNKMPFGNGSNGYSAYGVKAAAKGIFDIEDLHKLNTAQAAYLAGLLKAPSEYSAFNGRGQVDEDKLEKALARQKVVLARMVTVGTLTESEHQAALRFDIRSSLAEPKEKAYTTYPYLMIEAERRAAELLLLQQNPSLTAQDLRRRENAGIIEDTIEHMNRSGYRIYTTIDQKMYDAVQEIARNPENFTEDHPEKGVEQIGAMMIDNASGAILAMMEGRSYYIEQLNHATQAVRQPGSAMKPIAAYIPAMEEGLIQPGMPIDDSPIILKDGGKGAHVPENHNNRYHGLVSARVALNQSYNIPALRLFLSEYGGVGIEKAWEYTKKMGITTLTERDNGAQTGVIGGLTEGVSVEELTNAYATIPNKGVYKDAYMIERIEDAEGKPVYEHQSQPVPVYSEETAYLMTDMLRTVISGGTGSSIRSGFKYYNDIPVYGKTGTTSNEYDVWFVGFSPDITLGVWAGYDQPSRLVRNQGTARARNIWALVMNTAVEIRPEWFVTEKIERPANIVELTVSSVSGKLPNDLTRSENYLSRDLFNKKFLPTQEEDMLVRMKVITYNGVNYMAQPTTPEDFLVEKTVINRQPTVQAVINQLKETFEQYPQANSNKRSLDFYRTPDMDKEAPAEPDPRVDDGSAPPAPAGLNLAKEDGVYRLYFNPVAAEDVVGYRLYRSNNFGLFSRVEGMVILAGDERIFRVPVGFGNEAFYVTAVDVAGNESQASAYVFGSGSMIDPGLLLPPDGTIPGDGVSDGGDGDGGAGGTGTGVGTGGNNAPQANALPTAPSGLHIASRDGGIGILLTWNDNARDESVSQYKVFYSETADGSYRFIGATDKNRLEYISFPSEGWYRVVAVNSRGDSPASNAVEMKPAAQ